MPGRLPNHGFREGSGAVFWDRVPGGFLGRFRAGFQFGQVPGKVRRRFRVGSRGAQAGF